MIGVMLSVASGVAADAGATTFKVRIDNIVQGNGLTLSTGGTAPFAVSPGIWLVHTTPAPVFKHGEADRGQGLEAQAEDGNPAVLAQSLAQQSGVQADGVFTMPIGAKKPGAIGPGGAYEFEVTAAPGTRLTFVAMSGQSNDLFYAPQDEGIALFNPQGQPIQGDITNTLVLWDAGTEVHQEPGAGPDQALRQSAPNTGAEEHGVVRPVQDQFTYPPTRDVLRVTITPLTHQLRTSQKEPDGPRASNASGPPWVSSRAQTTCRVGVTTQGTPTHGRL
jgi:hypothetical protein